MKKRIWILVAVLAFLSAGILFFVLGKISNQKREAAKEYENMQRRQQVESVAETVRESERVKPDIPVDFESLQKDNPDIYAWITIPGTEIDYPVVQSSTDNTYYLNHTAEKTESVSGAIFSENYNSTNFDDYITVLYGHDMRDGSMFAGLHQYEDNIFMQEHENLTVYLPDAILKYKIFAAYLTDDKHVLFYYDQGKTEENRKAYINEIMSQRTMQASLNTEASVDENSKILTLSTCHGAGDQYRYLVQAYLVEEIK